MINILLLLLLIYFILFSTAQSTNTYRLGSQRKPLYAQPPGLSAPSPTITPPVVPFSNLTLPSSVNYPVAPHGAMEVPQTSATATLTPTPLQYQSPVNAENQPLHSVVPPSFTNLVTVWFWILQVGLHPSQTRYWVWIFILMNIFIIVLVQQIFVMGTFPFCMFIMWIK